MKYAPSYFEHNAGQAQLHVPAASKDIIEFTDETIEVKTISVGDLTEEQRAAYESAFINLTLDRTGEPR